MKITRPADIGALIRGYRERHGLTQAELAQRLHTTQKWISHIENGKPTAQVGLVLKALNLLGLTVSVSEEPEAAKRASRKGYSIDDIVDR